MSVFDIEPADLELLLEYTLIDYTYFEADLKAIAVKNIAELTINERNNISTIYRHFKNKAIRRQEYENAAQYRDLERKYGL